MVLRGRKTDGEEEEEAEAERRRKERREKDVATTAERRSVGTHALWSGKGVRVEGGGSRSRSRRGGVAEAARVTKSGGGGEGKIETR